MKEHKKKKKQRKEWEVGKGIFLFLLAVYSLALNACEAHAELRNGMDADVVLGQPNFNSNTADNGGVSARSMQSPFRSLVVNGKLLVSDQGNNRILIFNKIPTTSFAPADVVLGQPDFVTDAVNAGGAAGQATLRSPYMFCTDGMKLIVPDRNNNRVMIWNKVPTQNFVPADVVIGQINFTNVAANQGGAAAANTVSNPRACATDGKRLLITESGNNRVLLFQSIPTSNNASANVVLGQSQFSGAAAGTSRVAINSPRGIAIDGTRIYLADRTNSRILIWNQFPSGNGEPADRVLGQENFFSATTNASGVSARSLSLPIDVHTNGKQLFVADNTNNRALIFNELPSRNQVAADYALGQSSFLSNAAGVGRRGMSQPVGIFTAQGKIIVSEFLNHRVLIFNVGERSPEDLGAQFSQGKAVVGKVFYDWNGNGRQDK